MAGWIEVPNQPAQPYVPRCTWLDGDHTNGIDTSAIKIDFFAYSQTLSETVNSNAACSKTMFSGNTDDIDGVPMPMPKLDHLAPFSNTLVGLQQKKKRSMKGVQRREWMEKRLVVSDFPQQNATELCLDDLSYGPDAVGSDGYYCDMSTRELSPLCSFQDVEGCVNVDAQKNKITKRSSVAKRSVHLVHRSYDKMHMLNFN